MKISKKVFSRVTVSSLSLSLSLPLSLSLSLSPVSLFQSDHSAAIEASSYPVGARAGGGAAEAAAAAGCLLKPPPLPPAPPPPLPPAPPPPLPLPPLRCALSPPPPPPPPTRCCLWPPFSPGPPPSTTAPTIWAFRFPFPPGWGPRRPALLQLEKWKLRSLSERSHSSLVLRSASTRAMCG